MRGNGGQVRRKQSYFLQSSDSETPGAALGNNRPLLPRENVVSHRINHHPAGKSNPRIWANLWPARCCQTPRLLYIYPQWCPFPGIASCYCRFVPYVVIHYTNCHRVRIPIIRAGYSETSQQTFWKTSKKWHNLNSRKLMCETSDKSLPAPEQCFTSRIVPARRWVHHTESTNNPEGKKMPSPLRQKQGPLFQEPVNETDPYFAPASSSSRESEQCQFYNLFYSPRTSGGEVK